MYYGGINSGMIAGMMKRRIEKYKVIVGKLLNKEILSKEDKAFLEKEDVE